MEAFANVNEGYSLDRVIADPDLNGRLADECQSLGLPGDARAWNHALFNLRKRGSLARFPTQCRTVLDLQRYDKFRFASEIAWKGVMVELQAKSLDDILCDPSLAKEFDRRAKSFAPGFKSWEYRWAALKLRKMAHDARARAEVLNLDPDKLERPFGAFKTASKRAPDSAGVYLVSALDENLYVGETLSLKSRFDVQFADKRQGAWKRLCAVEVEDLEVRVFPMEVSFTDLVAYQSILIRNLNPRLNSENLAAV